MTPARRFALLGAFLAADAVAAGAFAAHWLRDRLAPAALTTFETAVRYQMYHALALLLLAALWPSLGGRGERVASASGWLFVAGIILFSGSLYGLAFTGVRALGMITPLGGVAFLSAWALLLWALARSRP